MRGAFRRDVVERLLAAWCGLRHVASLQLAREELAAGRTAGAAQAAQASAASALDSYLAAKGEAFPSLKWRFEKLARLQGATSPLYRRAWQLKAAGQADAKAYIDGVAALGRELGLQAYDAWTLDAVPLQLVGDCLSHTLAGDAFLVQDRRFVYGVDAPALGVVEALRGVPAPAASWPPMPLIPTLCARRSRRSRRATWSAPTSCGGSG